MLSFLPAPLIGAITILLYLLNLLFWPFVLCFLAVLKLLPIQSLRNAIDNIINQLPYYWQDVNESFQWLIVRPRYHIEGAESLRQNDWYLLICNHQSWADILVLTQVFNRKIPP